MKTNVIEAINTQIREEFESSYIYLAMSARFEALNFHGAAIWMRNQAREEVLHAMKFFDFLVRRGAEPRLEAIKQPTVQFDRPIEGFEQALEHERHITSCIHKLYDLAQSERDYALQTLLHWYIDEQVEEEETAEGIINSLRLAGDSGQGLFMIDRELGQRQAEAEAPAE